MIFPTRDNLAQAISWLKRCYGLLAPSLRAQRLRKFKILKISSQIENFKRATHQTPIVSGKFRRSGLKFSSEIEIFKRD